MGVVVIRLASQRYDELDLAMSARGYLHLVPHGTGEAERLHRLPIRGMYWTPEVTDADELMADALEAVAGETGAQVIVTAGPTRWTGLLPIDDG